MRVTITFVAMPGDVQVEAVTMRINTSDFALAISRAVGFASTFTTVPVESILIEAK